MSVSEADFAALVARVRVLEDERGILDTLHRYTRGIDRREPEDWAAVFTEDCVYELRSRHRATHRQEGREALLQFLRTAVVGTERVFGDVEPVSPSDHVVKHLCVDPRISLDGDAARVESYFAHLDDLHGMPVLWTYGRYVDRLVRCDDGVWRIAERIVEQEALHPAGRG
jgi:3-phenylpropionate/cinnamic acid dioxygenase small subunit